MLVFVFFSYNIAILGSLLLFFWSFQCLNSPIQNAQLFGPKKITGKNYQRVEGQEFTRCDLLVLIFLGGSGDCLTPTKRAKESSELCFFCEMIRDSPFKV